MFGILFGLMMGGGMFFLVIWPAIKESRASDEPDNDSED